MSEPTRTPSTAALSNGSSAAASSSPACGSGTVKLLGTRESRRPAPFSSSMPGRSAAVSRPKCDRNASVVP
jgi:hypothetical protein